MPESKAVELTYEGGWKHLHDIRTTLYGIWAVATIILFALGMIHTELKTLNENTRILHGGEHLTD